MEVTPQQLQEWERDFEAAARRSLRERMRYSFIYTYKPVLDDAPYRSFNTMKELGFELSAETEQDLLQGKDFIQLRGGPFDLDLVFAPDGIETFEEALQHSVFLDGQFPLASLDDIISSKRSANRPKDREGLPRLEAFRDFLRRRGLIALPRNPAP